MLPLARFSVVLMLSAGVSACGARDPLTLVISDAPALIPGVDAAKVSTDRDAPDHADRADVVDTAPGEADAPGVVDAAYASDATADAGGAPTCAMALDPTFGNAGIVTLTNPPNPAPRAIAFQSNGQILVGAGDHWGGPISVARFDAIGSLDTTFGADGFAQLSTLPSESNPAGVVVQPDGKILAIGWDANTPTLARLDRHGALDGTFGQGGRAV